MVTLIVVGKVVYSKSRTERDVDCVSIGVGEVT